MSISPASVKKFKDQEVAKAGPAAKSSKPTFLRTTIDFFKKIGASAPPPPAISASVISLSSSEEGWLDVTSPEEEAKKLERDQKHLDFSREHYVNPRENVMSDLNILRCVESTIRCWSFTTLGYDPVAKAAVDKEAILAVIHLSESLYTRFAQSISIHREPVPADYFLAVSLAVKSNIEEKAEITKWIFEYFLEPGSYPTNIRDAEVEFFKQIGWHIPHLIDRAKLAESANELEDLELKLSELREFEATAARFASYFSEETPEGRAFLANNEKKASGDAAWNKRVKERKSFILDFKQKRKKLADELKINPTEIKKDHRIFSGAFMNDIYEVISWGHPLDEKQQLVFDMKVALDQIEKIETRFRAEFESRHG